VRRPVLRRGTEQLYILWVTSAWPHSQRSSFSAALFLRLDARLDIEKAMRTKDIEYFKYFVEAEKVRLSYGLWVYAV
jgi:hypothetical protein